ncbi:MAG: hypothetical protein KF773_05030 [Deltaproteobacteria bacterium]|nr:hypothetical protein [Deltaproteobacteria bacterium]MCW5802140.1 hypothetical protein [Deltaproteobacteria bacterium]
MTTWRTDPHLAGRFHPQYPDDLQVMVHDGEPRRTKLAPEACWVRVTGVAGALYMPIAAPDASPPISQSAVRWDQRTVYQGTLLNAPHNLRTIRQNDTVAFVFAPGLPHPVLVTSEYGGERRNWCITPCNGCGADQTLDPMTTMARTRFPDTPAGTAPLAFSALCPCGGTMMLALVGQ